MLTLLLQKIGVLRSPSALSNVFIQAHVNGAEYKEPESHHNWDWPKNTYLSRRLNQVQQQSVDISSKGTAQDGNAMPQMQRKDNSARGSTTPGKRSKKKKRLH